MHTGMAPALARARASLGLEGSLPTDFISLAISPDDLGPARLGLRLVD